MNSVKNKLRETKNILEDVKGYIWNGRLKVIRDNQSSCGNCLSCHVYTRFLLWCLKSF